MKKNAFNIGLVLIVAITLAVCAFYVRIGATADAVVVLKTSGMTRGACIAKISNALQAERGVAATEVDLVGGWVIAGYDSKQVAPAKLAQAVIRSGFASNVQTVLTPEQFRKIVGHDIGKQTAGSDCCGAQGCPGDK